MGVNTRITPGGASAAVTPTGSLATPPVLAVALTDGNGNLQKVTDNGDGTYSAAGSSVSLAGATDAPADARANPTTNQPVTSYLQGYNGTTWDRLRSTIANGLAVDVTRVTGTVTVDSELPAAAALADSTANPTVPSVGSLPLLWNFVTWNRQAAANGPSDGYGGAGATVAAPWVYNGSTFDRARSAAGVTGAQAVGGLTASGSAVAAAPVTAGGLAKTAQPTAVADGQVVNSLHDKLGKQVVVGSVRDLKVAQQTTITSSTSETTILTQVASTFLDLYALVITNSSATGTKVTIKDATGGTTRLVFYVPANDTRGFTLPESAAHAQAVVNTNWTATCGTSVASVDITALAVKTI